MVINFIEPKFWRVFNSRVSQLDASWAALFEGLLQQERLQDRVELLSNVFKEHLSHDANTRWSFIFTIIYFRMQITL